MDTLTKPTTPLGPGGTRPGPEQCHDITVYPAIGLAGGACAGYGVLLDIRDPGNPRRLAAAADSNFAFWHSATFNNDGTKLLFTDEWGGGLAPKCRATDKPEWGADALFTVSHDTLTFRSYYKMPAPQTPQENCVAHNGSLIPVPGRDLMVQGWYQGGVSVFDFTDAAHPREIAFFDRGPMDSTKLVVGVLVQRVHRQLRDRAWARRVRAGAERVAVAERDRRREAGAFRSAQRPGPAAARLAAELRGRARLSRSAGPVERPGGGQDRRRARRAHERRAPVGAGAQGRAHATRDTAAR